MKKKIPWLTKEERRHMETLRNDLERQLQRERNTSKVRELERQIITLSRELEY